jgi:hypothetical protein
VIFIKVSTKNLNLIIPRDGEGASFNKKPIITVERTKKEDPVKKITKSGNPDTSHRVPWVMGISPGHNTWTAFLSLLFGLQLSD